jgi:hypothetical protein
MTFRLALLATASLALTAPTAQADELVSSGLSGGPVTVLHVLGGTSITQNVDPTTITANSIACAASGGGPTRENSYYRRFDLQATGTSSITSVRFAMENVTGASAPNVEVRLHSIGNGAPFVLANLTPIGSATAATPEGSNYFVDTNVAGNLDPVANDLVVELFVPDGDPSASRLFVGSNNLGQTAPSFIRAPGCGLSEPGDMASLGFPNMHLILVVNGTNLPVELQSFEID